MRELFPLQLKNIKIECKMDKEYKKAFMECCSVNGMDVIDVSPLMIAEYKKSYAVLPT